MDVATDKLDLYSIPVFLVELLALLGLAYAAHFLHFQRKPEPYLSGFYCDDISLRHEHAESKLTEQFNKPDNELVLLSLLLAVPILVIVFCELVNSLFGALKFRKIRALCRCCKLHSITRRTIRFAGAYILGFLLVMISCNVLANSAGHLKPYFAQECPQAFRDCPAALGQPQAPATSAPQLFNGGGGGAATASGLAAANWTTLQPSAVPATLNMNENENGNNNNKNADTIVRPPSRPIMSEAAAGAVEPLRGPAARLVRNRRDLLLATTGNKLLERKWIILENVNLAELCQFGGDALQTRRFDQLAMSWPSFPASIVSYACLFLASYLSFVGTARPFRLLTSVLVLALLLAGLVFNVQLVKEHYSHWEDALAGALLAGAMVAFVLVVYLNKFRDSHYYQNQKLHHKQHRGQPGLGGPNESANYNGYSNEIALEQFNLDKTTDEQVGEHSGSQQNSGEANGSVQNNDLPMRYFQIPRANYRGAPRPLSSATNHM